MRLDVAFDLDFSLCCGQVFRWKKMGNWWYGVVGDNIIKIRQCDNQLEFEGASEEFVRHYFGLNDDLTQISQSINKDPVIEQALERFGGLRLVRQEPWACLIGFICSIQKNIPAIEQMLSKMAFKFGEKRVFDGKDFYLLPSAERLAVASENGLRECGLGFRAKYVQGTARKICDEHINLNDLQALPYLQARNVLLGFLGVGLKVADCVLLFSLEKTEAFPVDVWVKRVVLKYYANHFPPELVAKMQSRNSLTNGEYQKIGDFARSYFGKYAGYAQEYLYHYERTQQ
ncbi:MAG: 8-oxoguanine DNA glycosylase [Candidatus Bathyarchaeota archaeon]|nr:8-oxoguanine DNA glycosylase [Candidatus Bathyarchaeota archaeon]